MRERLLRLTVVLTFVAWVLSIAFGATRGSSAMFVVAIALTVITGLIALSPARRFTPPDETRPTMSERDLDLVRQAIREKKDVSFVYQAKDGSKTTRRVTPLELFEVGETPCLGAFCHLRNGERTFVLERVGPVTLEKFAQGRGSGNQEVR